MEIHARVPAQVSAHYSKTVDVSGGIRFQVRNT